ncbi:DNA polymerase I [Desulfovibrio inopinatus]|uniref:DNA polymerase I n=1 Tax=Desulfovibrio inopinatus TaxID=102109 RepID=UPI000414B308|nr:DNA polymerase I [Desulfovibrio inopinatus]
MSLAQKCPLDSNPIYLIDGSSFFYRGFYALRDLSRSDGFPTNALFVVIRLLVRLLKEENPTYIAFILDGRGKNFRHEIFPEYKANRDAMPEPLVQQIAPLRQGINLLGIPVIIRENVEADDVIASLAFRFKATHPVVIVGSDKDLRQCLDKQVIMWDPAGKKEKIVTLDDFHNEFGLPPNHWADFQALTGDASDNIPGVPGVGPKTAMTILEQFPTLEELAAHVTELKPNLRKKIESHIDAVFTYRELTRLRTDLAQDIPLETLAPTPSDAAAMASFLREYEFRSLAAEFAALAKDAPAVKPASPAKVGEQLSLFPQSSPQAAPIEAAPIHPEDLPDMTGKSVAIIEANKTLYVAWDTEERRLAGTEHEAALAQRVRNAQTVVTTSVKDMFARNAAWCDIPLTTWFDLGLAAYLLSPEQRNYQFERLRESLLLDPNHDPSSLPEGSRGLAGLALADLFDRQLETAGLKQLIADLELPLEPVLFTMEQRGIGIDRGAFSSFLGEVETDLNRLTETIEQQAGKSFNLRSSQQLAEVLFNDLGLKTKGKTPGGAASTSVAVLEQLQDAHPIIGSILEFRKLEKLRSTYLEPLPKLADDQDRIHTTFDQLATATGRLSSKNPNLQNIPVRGRLGQRMRACFTAGPGNLLAAADYSQIELRVLAHMSQDPTLMDAFTRGIDIHARTAGLLFDKEPAEVAKEERRLAKTINFGLLYGMGPQKLGRELGLTLPQAKEFIVKYFERLTALKTFYDHVVEDARDNGFVTTLAGRRRMLPDLRSRNNQLASQAKRQAINTVIQGSAADIIKKAMLRVEADSTLAELDARLLLQIHDELLVECPIAQAEAAGERLALIMSEVYKLSVPLAVDKGIGKSWADAH